ncbi:MAG: tetratricopeptide repeat protein [Myxococcales bacterium]|nr:tetratricopeptide repeat protein [Myxococcales bacterium]
MKDDRAAAPAPRAGSPWPARLWWVGALLVALNLGSALGHDFVWDDLHNLPGNRIYRGPVLDAVRATELDYIAPEERARHDRVSAHDSYRPVMHLSYRLGIAVSGMEPAGLRAQNYLMGLLTAWLVYLIACRLGRRELESRYAALLLAAHPLSVETLVYLSARADLMSTMFGLLSVLLVLECGERQAASRGLRASAPLLAGVALAYAASLLSKEGLLALPLATALWLWALGRLRAGLPGIVTQLACLGLYLPFRLAMAGGNGASQLPEAIAALPGLWLEELRRVLLPTDLNIAQPPDSSLGWVGWVALAGWVGSFVLTTTRLWQQPQADTRGARGARIVIAGTGFGALCLGPSAVVVLIMGVRGDRYSFPLVAGACITLVVLLSELWRMRARLRGLLAAAIAGWAALLLFFQAVQAASWHDHEALYRHAVTVAPDSPRANYGLAYVLAKQGRWALAHPLFERARELSPGDVRTLNNLGLTYLRLGQPELAEASLRQALTHSAGGHAPAHFNLALVMLQRGRRAEACQAAADTLALRPDHKRATALRARLCEGAAEAP